MFVYITLSNVNLLRFRVLSYTIKKVFSDVIALSSYEIIGMQIYFNG